MKISIITPVYNEEKSIKQYFNAINKLKYPKDDLEIIFVNDGSKDNSTSKLHEEKNKSQLDIKIIDLKQNEGRSMAREHGAKAAKYNNLLLLDCKCEIFPDALEKLKTLNYSPVNFSVIQKNTHVTDIFFSMVRRKIYKHNFGDNFKDNYITQDNFDEMGKGTTAFFCDKALFLESQLTNKTSKDNSDDTKLIWNIVKKKKILLTQKARIYYNTRTDIFENIVHIFHRGPKFVDYYYTPSKKWFWIINATLLATIIIATSIITKKYTYEILLAILGANTLISIYLAQKIKDFFIAFIFFPIFSISFFSGIIKGLILKILKKY